MHMEAVQKYVISLSEEELVELYKEMGMLESGVFLDSPKLFSLYETLEVWSVP